MSRSGGGYPGGGGGYPSGGGGYPGGGGGYPGGGGGRRSSMPGTTLYDAIYLASNEIMSKQQGRKAVILLTDGVDNGSKTFLNDAIEASQRSDTLVYSILFSDEQQQVYRPPVTFGGMGGGRRRGGMPPGGMAQQHPDGKKVLQRISRETGGSFFEVSKKMSIDDIFDRIQEELRNQYSIGYTSDKGEASGYRAIKVTTKQSGYTVTAREGYYPATRSVEPLTSGPVPVLTIGATAAASKTPLYRRPLKKNLGVRHDALRLPSLPISPAPCICARRDRR